MFILIFKINLYIARVINLVFSKKIKNIDNILTVKLSDDKLPLILWSIINFFFLKFSYFPLFYIINLFFLKLNLRDKIYFFYISDFVKAARYCRTDQINGPDRRTTKSSS